MSNLNQVADDMYLLADRIGRLCGDEGSPEWHKANEVEIRPLTIYQWCYSKEEFLKACKWLSTGGAEVNYQATELSLSETLPGGTRIVVNCPYDKLDGAYSKPKPVEPTFVPQGEIASLIKEKTQRCEATPAEQDGLTAK